MNIPGKDTCSLRPQKADEQDFGSWMNDSFDRNKTSRMQHLEQQYPLVKRLSVKSDACANMLGRERGCPAVINGEEMDARNRKVSMTN